jgi:hypothetical protein
VFAQGEVEPVSVIRVTGSGHVREEGVRRERRYGDRGPIDHEMVDTDLAVRVSIVGIGDVRDLDRVDGIREASDAEYQLRRFRVRINVVVVVSSRVASGTGGGAVEADLSHAVVVRQVAPPLERRRRGGKGEGENVGVGSEPGGRTVEAWLGSSGTERRPVLCTLGRVDDSGIRSGERQAGENGWDTDAKSEKGSEEGERHVEISDREIGICSC